MILGFKTTTPTGPTHFPAKILLGKQVQPNYDTAHVFDLQPVWNSKPKIHTLREDAGHRWRAGMPIQFATGLRTPAYKQFASGTCTGVQTAKLWTDGIQVFVEVERKRLEGRERLQFYQNDGFDSLAAFQEWFLQLCRKHQEAGNSKLELRIIHWTDFRY